jgi:DNA invertase Pin-like site-specific DNA recombinase
MSTDLEHLSVSPEEARAILRNGPAVIRAGIYVRISSDRTGAGLGVARQEEDCRELCGRLGWTVYRVYADNDVSAYTGKPRPQWDQLMADIAAGLVSAVACWHVDRLTRSPRELEEVIDLHDKRGVLLATVTGEMDLSTPTGRMLARMLGAAARHEAEHKAERQRRAGIQKARAGQPHPGGSRRGYGYQADGVTVIPAEAAIITEAARRALAGESPRSIAADLNARAVPSATGRAWSAQVLRGVLTSGRVSGRREHHGQIANEESWPPIISPADSDQLRVLLAARPGRRASSRRHLLSGILTCELCGHGLYARPHAGGRHRYVCVKDPGKDGCGKVTISADHAEEEVRNQVLAALDSAGFVAALLAAAGGTPADAEAISARLRVIDGRRDDLAEMWAAGEISRKEWLAARDRLSADADALTAELSRTQHGRALAQFAAAAGTPWDRWATLTTGARRALIQAAAAAIRVRPATTRGWNPARICTPDWRA